MTAQNKKGFTLVELMIVMAVIAILATLALFGVRRAQAAARDAQRQQIMTGIQAALERYYGDNNNYPADLMTVPAGGAAVLGGYLPAASMPVDPGCGTNTVPMTAWTTTWTPAPNGGCAAGAVTYRYAPVAATGGYTLTLVKESGGTNLFKSPQ